MWFCLELSCLSLRDSKNATTAIETSNKLLSVEKLPSGGSGCINHTPCMPQAQELLTSAIRLHVSLFVHVCGGGGEGIFVSFCFGVFCFVFLLLSVFCLKERELKVM